MTTTTTIHPAVRDLAYEAVASHWPVICRFPSSRGERIILRRYGNLLEMSAAAYDDARDEFARDFEMSFYHDFGHYPDETPELDGWEPSEVDEAWWQEQTRC